jgi:prevent-host-death family protein
MQILNLHHAKAQLSRLVEQALAGEEIIIARAGKPMVRLTPCQNDDQPRKLGIWKDKGVWIADDFDAPLSSEDIKTWCEGDI